MSRKKELVARWVCRFGLDRVSRALQHSLFGPSIRVVNYHDVAPDRAADFERQVQYYAENFDRVSPESLLSPGEWSLPRERPGILITFDDGLRSHADVAAPILEEYGFAGWFMVPVAFVETLPEDQIEFAEAHQILHSGHDYGDPRIAMTWEDARRMSDRHVIGCHTWNHTRLSAELTSDQLRKEIPEAKAFMESKLDHDISVFAWVGGEEWSYSAGAARAIADAGFSLSFMTNNQLVRPGTDRLQLQRTNVEAFDSDDVVRFQLSGIMDVMYMPKRKRVNSLTATSR